MEELIIREVYSVTPVGDMVAVDFLQVSETGTYRMFKYFYKDEWEEDISKNLVFKKCRAFDKSSTIAKEVKIC